MYTVEKFLKEDIPKQYKFKKLKDALRFMDKLKKTGDFHAIFKSEDDIYYDEDVPFTRKESIRANQISDLLDFKNELKRLKKENKLEKALELIEKF